MKRTEKNDPAAELAERFTRWDFLYQHGCSDPTWSDGVNLNLVRNHIIYYKNKLEDSCSDNAYPDIYYWDTPPEVNQNYMARTDEIRSNAQKSLGIYRSDPHYLYCKKYALELTAKELKRFPVENVLGYVSGLKDAIAADDLITMRRHEDSNRYLDSFARCESEIRKMFSERELDPQMSLFSFTDPDTDDFQDDEDEEFTQNMI
ncbi:MAG: hypothetical protein PHV32_00515 [Eubacteriales bacterium]|nr:hypothetical protein [Eubacteriales bacterium]